jgi:hypothetical protein
MSLLSEMEKHGLADCEFNNTLTNRQFMQDDISAMMKALSGYEPIRTYEIMLKLSDDGLYQLWRDLMTIQQSTMKESTE